MDQGNQVKNQFIKANIDFVNNQCAKLLMRKFKDAYSKDLADLATDQVFINVTIRSQQTWEKLYEWFTDKDNTSIRKYLLKVSQSVCSTLTLQGVNIRAFDALVEYPEYIPKKRRKGSIISKVEYDLIYQDQFKVFLKYLEEIPQRGNRIGGDTLIQVLQLQLKELSNVEICTELHLSPSNLDSIIRKIKVHAKRFFVDEQ